jgi:nucleoside-diphosphate-sugar epimerase
MSLRVLVTGGSGFIGAALSRNFIQRGYEVKVFDNGSRGRMRRLDDVKKDFEYIEADIRDTDAVLQATKNIDVLFHLAFINGTANFYSRPAEILDIGIQGMYNVLKAVKENNVGQFFLASSSEVYQVPTIFPTPEDVPLVVPDVSNPRYSYGLGKIVQEFLLTHAAPEIPRKIVFRPHNIYGPDMGNMHVIPELFEKIRDSRDGKLVLKGDGTQSRSFCYINDFVQAINVILDSDIKSSTLNIGTPEEVTILELAGQIMATLSRHLEVEHVVSPSGETNRRLPDISKVESLGFKQNVDLRAGLELYNSWFSTEGEAE